MKKNRPKLRKTTNVQLNFWLLMTDLDYIAGRLLHFTGFHFQPPVLFHHAIEKYLKAYLISQGEKVEKNSKVWGHDLVRLSKLCKKYDKDFGNAAVRRRLEYMTRHFSMSRYADDFEKMSKNIWYGYPNIETADELVAFIRPRIKLAKKDWESSILHSLVLSTDKKGGYRKRALTDQNKFLNIIDCKKTKKVSIEFSDFHYDTGVC